jgi:hypothetical protein
MQSAMWAVAGWWFAADASSGMVAVVAVVRHRMSLVMVCWNMSDGRFMVKRQKQNAEWLC